MSQKKDSIPTPEDHKHVIMSANQTEDANLPELNLTEEQQQEIAEKEAERKKILQDTEDKLRSLSK